MDLEQYAAKIEEAGGVRQFFSVESRLELTVKEALVREAVEFHYAPEGDDSPYNPGMTLDDLDELGEGIGLDIVTDKDGLRMYRVDLGAGGNSFMYFFDCEDEARLPMMIIDRLELYDLDADESYKV